MSALGFQGQESGVLPVLVELQVVSTTSLTSMSLKPDQAELGPTKHKAAFPGSCISSIGRIGKAYLTERRQREHGLIGKHACRVIGGVGSPI